MTASSPSGPAQLNNGAPPPNSLSRSVQSSSARQAQPTCNNTPNSSTSSSSSTSAFHLIKQTQASLARQSHVHQQLQAATNNNNNNNITSSSNINTFNGAATSGVNISQNPHQQQLQGNNAGQNSQSSQQQKQAATFVDCLIRRFKNCFSEDSCTVPMFVVGNLSPGIDGTHLILPPCVSLGRQGINRFSSPKNLRLMSSIRESCRSIEELDLGGNKLADLIEVYKILQLTPNLRFLNLSENDLSRTAPVAMASSCASDSAANPGQWSTHLGAQRCCLAPLNQNTGPCLGARRHSTLGQPAASSSVVRPAVGSAAARGAQARQTSGGASRVAEARRLAAANALAQSKKTSSSVASKLASSAASSVVGSVTATHDQRGHMRPAPARQAGCARLQSSASGTPRRAAASPPASTMHLARSLSSLSAKDLRGSAHHHRANLRADQRQSAAASAANRRRNSAGTARQAVPNSAVCSNGGVKEPQMGSDEVSKTTCKLPTSSSHHLLYVEPTIVETDADVDMSQTESAQAQQQQPGSTQRSPAGAFGHAPSTVSQQRQPIKAFNTLSAAPFLGLVPGATATSTGSQVSSGSNTGGGSTSFRRTFESIKALALNNTGCQWRVVCSILSRMPNLEELHLSLNNYEKIDLEPNEFKHLSLKRLYLCNNPKLTNWEELDKLLIAFPSLEALSIANCSISEIPDNLDRAREWRKLCGLNINGWPIKEWPVVERLNQLPSLIDLKCRNLEVLSTIDQPRHHLIARLPKLQRLNGSEIEEREEAEKAFVRFFMANSHLERPSRFHELMQIYGEISTVDVDVDLSPPSQAQIRVIYLNRSYYRKENNDDIMMSEDFLLKLMDNAESGSSSNNVVQVKQQHQQHEQESDNPTAITATTSQAELQENKMDIAVDATTLVTTDSKSPVRLFKDEGQEIVALNVDLRQSVRKFKSNLASLFGLDSQSLILYYIDHEMVGLMGPELLKHNQKKLWNYNVQDGDQFIVEER